MAGRYLAIIRHRDRYSASDLMHAVHPLLAELYVTGFALPVKPDSAFGDDEEDSGVPEPDRAALERHSKRWQSVCSTLAKQIGPRWLHYQEVFDPYAEPAEAPVTGSLADDLADIFLDLEDGESLWLQGDFDAAVWKWQFGFESHWGEHVTGALRAIRTLAAVHDLGFPDPRTEQPG